MAASRPLDIDVGVTIVSAKHLKNVNWRHGQLKPYAVIYLVSDNNNIHTNSAADFHDKNLRFATKPDDAGSIRPVWNEKFTFPIAGALIDFSTLVIDIFHSKPSQTPKPLVGTVRCALRSLLDKSTPIATLELQRPSGRPQGKVRIKISSQQRPLPIPKPATLLPSTGDYHMSHLPCPYYNSNPNPSPTSSANIRDHRTYVSPVPTSSPYQYGNYGDALYTGYYSSVGDGYYSTPPAPTTRMAVLPSSSSYYQNRASSSYGGPSAPVVDYEQRLARNGFTGVGSVAGALGGLSLEQGLKYEEDKIEDYRPTYY